MFLPLLLCIKHTETKRDLVSFPPLLRDLAYRCVLDFLQPIVPLLLINVSPYWDSTVARNTRTEFTVQYTVVGFHVPN